MGYTCVWKMSWMASTDLLRICDASCMPRRARSTAITTSVGSAVPAASAREPVAASVEHAAEARAALVGGVGRAGAGNARDRGVAETDRPLAAADGERRIDWDHFRISSVLENICLAVCMTVTFAS
jgi:hypothetical protein